MHEIPATSAPIFRIDPRALYSREALALELQGLIELDTFLARVQPRKRFKNLYWGQDLIEALDGPLIEHAAGVPRTPSIVMEVKSRKKEGSQKNTSSGGGIGRLNPADFRNLR